MSVFVLAHSALASLRFSCVAVVKSHTVIITIMDESESYLHATLSLEIFSKTHNHCIVYTTRGEIQGYREPKINVLVYSNVEMITHQI